MRSFRGPGWRGSLSKSTASRTLALVAPFLSVSEIPFGTTLGIYTLIVLLHCACLSVIRSQKAHDERVDRAILIVI